jgi:hypothetical protein
MERDKLIKQYNRRAPKIIDIKVKQNDFPDIYQDVFYYREKYMNKK